MLAKNVWETLSQIDVTPHVEYMKKTSNRPAMRYLPWHKAWTIVKEHFPNIAYQHGEDILHEDGTMEVQVAVQFRDADEIYIEQCRLGVMDNNYNAIKNPNARQINDNRQRCLVKALAFAGLGLNLWSNDDTPVGLQGKPITEEQAERITELVEKSDSDLPKFLKWLAAESIETIAAEKFSTAERQLLKKVAQKVTK